ncbi:unnamed protein product, partial [Mesorhabditis spiculigera]
MSISTIRRQVKNVAYNFSDAQVKVREATSNDPWGPSTALMNEIADLTNNPMAFTEIMSIIWKRLNDHGKNWRHVYKSLVLLDFLIKCGNEKVAHQCRENIYAIETLKDFQHVEDNRDQGLNIREKAKQMASLLNDEERLKNERTRFMLTRNRLRQNGGTSVGAESGARSRRADYGGTSRNPGELDEARPSSLGEEEMQLQIALALSREEAEKANEMEKSDDIRLQMAIEESRREAEEMSKKTMGTVNSGQLSQSAIDDLLSLGLGDIVLSDPNQPTSSNQWGAAPAAMDPWGAPVQQQQQNMYPSAQLASNDPWAPSSLGTPTPAASLADPFSAWDTPLSAPTNGSDILQPTPANGGNSMANSAAANASGLARKTPENFLGENSNLVNLDDLLGTTTTATSSASNPFLLGTTSAPVNPFNTQRKSPTLNEMRAGAPPIPQVGPRVGGLPPLQPSQPNPFAGI